MTTNAPHWHVEGRCNSVDNAELWKLCFVVTAEYILYPVEHHVNQFIYVEK
jgi:hypothetical protein